ncbi:MAG: ACT domain-containing protein [Hyphomonadaceae bacterium]|nr:ACT domain-containing protein [Hyphomonadaceae bacterium]
MAEADLSRLLASLSVLKRDGVWRFETIDKDEASWAELINLREVREIAMLFQEAEGLTVITAATKTTPQDNRWTWLELSVFSDLQAVGFLAKVAAALTAADVPCNAVAAFHHDHIFVPEQKADAAIAAIEALRTAA